MTLGILKLNSGLFYCDYVHLLTLQTVYCDLPFCSVILIQSVTSAQHKSQPLSQSIQPEREAAVTQTWKTHAETGNEKSY